MRFDKVRDVVGGTPHTTPERGRQLYDHVIATGAHDVLELGFAHGVSTCYLAAALDELGRGRVMSIDNRTALDRRPTIHDLLARAGLAEYVRPIFSETSYTWELLGLIERATIHGRCRPMFDLVFVDGAHTWEVDGFAFFLADKLLRPGGWMVFDDVTWTLARSPSMRDLDWVRALPDDVRTTPQIEKVVSLLVYQHPGYTDRRVDGDWAWARKLPSTVRGRARRVLRALRLD